MKLDIANIFNNLQHSLSKQFLILIILKVKEN